MPGLDGIAAASHDAAAGIAAELYLSEGTVRNYLSAATRKLGARSPEGGGSNAEHRCFVCGVSACCDLDQVATGVLEVTVAPVSTSAALHGLAAGRAPGSSTSSTPSGWSGETTAANELR